MSEIILESGNGVKYFTKQSRGGLRQRSSSLRRSTMFIAMVVSKEAAAPSERNACPIGSSKEPQHYATPDLAEYVGSSIYKYFVPMGLVRRATQT